MEDQKRISVKLKCPNPLFEEWLIKWRDQAVAKECKTQYSYNHALASLRKYPLPLESGRDCKILKGFGDKLCKMLDEKLKNYKKENKDVITNKSNDVPLLSHGNLQFEADSNKKDVKTQYGKKESNKTGNNSKEYIPQYGSGAYAILVTLYKQSLEQDYPGFLKKAEIIHYGKDLVNASFTKPDPNSRYTAWSSMRTLISKNLVIKVSNPAKFSLTEEGIVLAKKLYERSNDSQVDTMLKCDLGDQMNGYSKIENICSYSEDQSNKVYKNNINLSNKSDKENNETFRSYDVDISDEFADQFLENMSIPDNVENGDYNSPLVQSNNQEFSTLSKEIISNNEFDDLGSRIISNSIRNTKVNENFTEPLEVVKLCDRKDTKTSFKRSLSSSSVNLRPNSVESIPKVSFQKFSSATSISSATSKASFTKSNKTSLKKTASSNSVSSVASSTSTFESFLMGPGSFDIILCVDSCETSGNRDDEVLSGLTKQNIKHDVRSLKVGDFTWICRERTSNKELVLPYIIERKRIDDLASSIKDQRYHEQKFRLKKSGMENLVYLIESHGKNQFVGLPLSNLYQAATNTAIQENFFVKFTNSTNETIEYLANFSKMLIKIFQSKTLASCSKDDLQAVDINDDLISLMTFPEFNRSSVKNKKMKVTDMFVKMLIQLKGISVERALAITEKYPTPKLLKKAYEEKSSVQGEKLLSDIKFGKSGKCIGVPISRTIYQAFTKRVY